MSLTLKIKNHPEYSVSTDGKIFSYKRCIYLKPDKAPNGYLIVTLDKHRVSIHRLVAQHFIPNPENLPLVRHLNNDKENNTIGNLAWGSHADNEDDKRVHGTYYTRITNSLLSEEDIQDIKYFKKLGARTNDLAKSYSIGRHAISNIVKGKTWSHL
jgi:hypothetical protein